MEEARRSLARRGIVADKRLADMQAAFEDANVTGYESLIPALRCDEDDRHVLAAAIVGRAEQIVTSNVRHFPPESVERYGIAIVTPDELLLNALDLSPHITLAAIRDQVKDLQKDPQRRFELVDVLGGLRKAGAPAFAEAIEPRLTQRL